MELTDFCFTHLALAAKRHHIRLGITPPFQRQCPFLRSAQVPDLSAGFNSGTIYNALAYWKNFFCSCVYHSLIQQLESFLKTSVLDKCLAFPQSTERDQVRILKSFTYSDRLFK